MSNPKSLHSNEMRDPILTSYMAEILKFPALKVEEERDLLRKAKEGDRRSLNKLVSSHLRFVVAVCWNYWQRGLPLSDLISEGNLALGGGAFRPG